MPRRRGRPKNARPRLTRMDAAVDAMLPFGFSEAKTKKHVKQLLEAYEGNQGWPFIEEGAYKVLLDSLLEDGDDEEVVQDGNLLEDKSCGEEDPSSVGASDTEKTVILPDVGESSAAAAAAGSIQPPLPPLPPPPPPPPPPLDDTGIPPPPPLVVAAANRRRRVPCFGWIESDEDDDDEFIDLPPMEMRMVRPTLDVTKWSKKRRSRWDVKPADF